MRNKYEVRMKEYVNEVDADGWMLDDTGNVLHFFNTPLPDSEEENIVESYSLVNVVSWKKKLQA